MEVRDQRADTRRGQKQDTTTQDGNDFTLKNFEDDSKEVEIK